MPGVWGYLVTGIASAYIIVFNVIVAFGWLQAVSCFSLEWHAVQTLLSKKGKPHDVL